MVTINLAYTAPINPAGTSQVLTQEQVWRGLELKVKRAHEFVPIIVSCDVISEDVDPATGNVKVLRQVVFRGGQNDDPVRETCVQYAPTKVAFEQENGSTILNVISKDAEEALWMSYIFEWRHPGVEAGSEEARELQATHWKTAKIAVEGSIDTIRRLVKQGDI